MSRNNSNSNSNSNSGSGSGSPFPLLSRQQLEQSVSRNETTNSEEIEIRFDFAYFIQQCGQLLQLPNGTICTAVVFFQRFYTIGSLKQFEPTLCAQACLFLASKVEENSRRVRDIINVAYRVQHPNQPPLQVSQVNKTKNHI
jgi:cyclin T